MIHRPDAAMQTFPNFFAGKTGGKTGGKAGGDTSGKSQKSHSAKAGLQVSEDACEMRFSKAQMSDKRARRKAHSTTQTTPQSHRQTHSHRFARDAHPSACP